MRLLQLNPNGTEESALDFHPVITVVSGLGPAGRAMVVKAVEALPRGTDPGCGGLVEAHGVMLDLTVDTLAMLDLQHQLDVLVQRADLPGSGGPAPAGQTAAGATTRMSVEQFLTATPPGLYPELDAARAGQLDALEALSILRDAVERSRRDLRDAMAKRERAVIALEDAQQAWAAVSAVGDDGEADDGESDAAITFNAREVAQRRAELEPRIDELPADLARIDRGLDELSAIDTRPVQVLLEALRNPTPVEYVASDRARELADQFVELQSAVNELEQKLEEQGRGPATAMQRLEDARRELAAAEKAMAKPELSPEDVAELEAVHEEVLEAEQKASGFGRRGQKKLDEVMAKQQAVLDRVGFPTWSAYVMGAGLLAIDPVAEQRLERARFDLEAAEAHWAQISAAIEADPKHSGLIDELETVYLEAFDLLEGEEPEDLETALRELKVPKREVTTEELVDALAYQLELVGLDLGDNPGEDRTIVVAEAFLEETALLTQRIDELKAERAEAEHELASAEHELSTLPEVDVDLIDDETIDLTDAAFEARGWSAGGPTEEDLEQLEVEVDTAREDEQDAAEALEAREALVDAATQVEAVATSRLMRIAAELAEQAATSPPSSDPGFEVTAGDDEADAGQEAIEFYLLNRLAALRNITYAGSVPLLLDDALLGVDPEEIRQLLTRLERMAEAVQIIYLTDDETVTAWALAAGFERAAVVDAPPVFAE
jgi:hypothetical protein